MTDQDIVDRLDRIIALYKLVNASALAERKEALGGDAVVRAILKETSDWIGASELKSVVAKAVSTSEKTVQRRTLELVDEGVLSVKKDGVNLFYKDAGLFG